VNYSQTERVIPTIKNILSKKILLLIAFLSLGAVVEVVAQGTAIRIMPLGDSITWGVDPDDPDSVGYRDSLYQQLITAGYNIDFVGSLVGGSIDPDHEGHPRWTAYHPSPSGGTGSLLDTLPQFLTNNPPDIILLHIGTNDLSSASDFDWGTDLADEVVGLLDTIYDFDNNITTIVAKIIDRNDLENRHLRTMNFNDTLEIKIDSLLGTRNQNIIIVDMYTALGLYYGTSDGSNPNFTYGIGSLYTLHPNTTGYGVMADLWFDSLRTVLPLLVDITVFLEGPYDDVGGAMSTALNSGEYLQASALSQPYSGSPWSYSGTESVNSGFFAGNTDIVDWVLVELRNKNDATDVIATRAGFLKSDGKIVDINGTSKLYFSGVPFDNYYITVKHRNHLAVMSNTPVTLSDYTLTYDFTTGSGQFAGGSAGAKQLDTSPVAWGMIAGDGTGNGGISIDDRNLVWRVENGTLGYKNGDYNMNGGVSIDDRNQYWRVNNGKISQVP
jgi:lysophospholipase L1-like esterase